MVMMCDREWASEMPRTSTWPHLNHDIALTQPDTRDITVKRPIQFEVIYVLLSMNRWCGFSATTMRYKKLFLIVPIVRQKWIIMVGKNG